MGAAGIEINKQIIARLVMCWFGLPSDLIIYRCLEIPPTSHVASHSSSGGRPTSAAPQLRRGMGALHGAQQGFVIDDRSAFILYSQYV